MPLVLEWFCFFRALYGSRLRLSNHNDDDDDFHFAELLSLSEKYPKIFIYSVMTILAIVEVSFLVANL